MNEIKEKELNTRARHEVWDEKERSKWMKERRISFKTWENLIGKKNKVTEKMKEREKKRGEGRWRNIEVEKERKKKRKIGVHERKRN